MLAVVQRRFRSLREWESAWLQPTVVPSLLRDLGATDGVRSDEAFQSAVHFLAGFLRRDGFELFRNGGLPLLERREGPWIEEVLVRLGPNPVEGAYLPVTVQVHLSHTGFREVRQRYWPSLSRPPIIVLSGNAGLVQSPPTFDLWNIASPSMLDELAGWLDHELLQFLADIESPSITRRQLFGDGITLVDAPTALEYILVEFGRAEATRYLEEVILAREGVFEGFREVYSAIAKTKSPGFVAGQHLRNVAVIAHAYDLIGRRRIR